VGGSRCQELLHRGGCSQKAHGFSERKGEPSRLTAHIMYDFIYKVQPALPRRALRRAGGTPLLQRQRVLPWNRGFEDITYHGRRVGQNTNGHTRVSPGPASPQERAPALRAFLAYLARHTQGGFDSDCRCEHTCLPLPPWAQAGSPSYCGDRAGQKAWQKITGTDTGGRLHGPDLSPSRKPWPPSYSNLKRGINHSSEIPNGGMQDAFLLERTLCIHIDGSYMAV
jgi:hypothetical protein